MSYMPLATNRFWSSQSSPVRNDTYYIHELDLRQASVPGRLRALLRVALRVVFVFPTGTVLLAWTRTDGKYLALTRIEETTLTRQLVGLKFSLKKLTKMGCKIIVLTAVLVAQGASALVDTMASARVRAKARLREALAQDDKVSNPDVIAAVDALCRSRPWTDGPRRT